MGKTLIVNNKEAHELLTMPDTIEIMRDVMAKVSEGKVQLLQRSMIYHESGNKLAIMAASMDYEGITGSKIIMFPSAKAQKEKTNQGIVPIFNIEDGSLIAIIDAEVMTVVRTAAVSAIATDYLSKKDAESLCILGTGRQGIAHIEAICKVREIKEIYLWNHNHESGKKACSDVAKKFNIKVSYYEEAKEAVKNADIICTTTKSHEPILKGKWIKKGAHINAVGACSNKVREVDENVLLISKVYVDQKEAAFKDAGDIIIPLEKGEIKKDIVIGEIGEVINGKIKGREDDNEITFFESVGLSVQDLASAKLIYDKAVAKNIGISIEI